MEAVNMFTALLLERTREDIRKIINGASSGLKTSLFNSIETLTDKLKLRDVHTREERVTARDVYIKQNPEEIHWDFAEFYPCTLYGPDNKRRSGVIYDVKISTRGDLIHFRNNKMYFHIAGESNCAKYVRVRINKLKYAVHRLMTCTFIPIPSKLVDVDISLLISNHLDLDPSNNYLSNLEWVDNGGNIHHAQDNNVKLVGDAYFNTKPLLLTVVAENRFKGRQYVLRGQSAFEDAGISYRSLQCVRSGEKNHNYGHIASNISMEESLRFHQGMPTDIKELFTKDRRYFSMDIKPVIGTILAGKHAGFQFSLFGASEMSEYFIQANILKCFNGSRNSHGGCSWKYGTIEEAIPLHGKLLEMLEFIRPMNR